MIKMLSEAVRIMVLPVISAACEIIKIEREYKESRRREELFKEKYKNHYCSTCDALIFPGEWHFSTCPLQKMQEEDPLSTDGAARMKRSVVHGLTQR